MYSIISRSPFTCFCSGTLQSECKAIEERSCGQTAVIPAVSGFKTKCSNSFLFCASIWNYLSLLLGWGAYDEFNNLPCGGRGVPVCVTLELQSHV
jgi:hypothetical protein